MNVVTFGELLLRLSPPHHQRIAQAQQFDVQFGGAEANVAVCLANWDVDSYCVTKVPDNELGQAVVNHLRKYGVKEDYVVRGGDRLGLYYLEIGAGHRPSKVIYDRAHSAITTLQPEDVDWAPIFAEADWFHWTGITPALGDNVAACVEAACRAARKAGTTISCDLNYRGKLWSPSEAKDAMCSLMQYVDVCIASVEEADVCLDIRIDDGPDGHIEMQTHVARALKEAFDFEAVAMTIREGLSASRHKYSAVLLDDEDCGDGYCAPEYDIDIVDRVGGGDAFAAGLIMGLHEKESTQDALDFAVAASALKHTIPGDVNLVQRDEVEQLMASPGTSRVER